MHVYACCHILNQITKKILNPRLNKNITVNRLIFLMRRMGSSKCLGSKWKDFLFRMIFLNFYSIIIKDENNSTNISNPGDTIYLVNFIEQSNGRQKGLSVIIKHYSTLT